MHLLMPLHQTLMEAQQIHWLMLVRGEVKGYGLVVNWDLLLDSKLGTVPELFGQVVSSCLVMNSLKNPLRELFL